MSGGRWLRQEREIARALGTRPLPERGVGEPAIRLPGWAVLVKTRATVPAWLWAALDQAARHAQEGERSAVVVSDVVQGRKARRLVLLDFDQWAALARPEEAMRRADEAPFPPGTGAESG